MNSEFKEKIQSLTAKEVVELMIDAMENPVIKLDFDSLPGAVAENKRIACAATNIVCKLTNKSEVSFEKDIDDLTFSAGRAHVFRINSMLLRNFEIIINFLRLGNIIYYNSWAGILKMTKLPIPVKQLPRLNNNFTKQELQAYKDYAETL